MSSDTITIPESPIPSNKPIDSNTVDAKKKINPKVKTGIIIVLVILGILAVVTGIAFGVFKSINPRGNKSIDNYRTTFIDNYKIY